MARDLQSLKKNCGSKIRIWREDAWLPHDDWRTTYVHTPVGAGPSDAELRVEFPSDDPHPPVEPDDNGDFLFDHENEHHQFNAAHTFAVARQVLTSYQRALERVGYSKHFEWQWGRSPLILRPLATEHKSAPLYSRNRRAIEFTYFKANEIYQREENGDPTQKDTTVYTCESFDFIAHEMGHAILDGFKPGYGDSSSREVEELKEAFADLATLFTLLGQMEMVEAAVTESRADLSEPNFLSAIAERYPQATSSGKRVGLRFLLNASSAATRTGRPHVDSQIFSGAVYDILASLLKDHVQLHHFDPAESLYRVGRHLQEVVVAAFLDGPSYNPSRKDIAMLMIRHEANPRWRSIMKSSFESRGILGAGIRMVRNSRSHTDVPTLPRNARTEQSA